MAGAVIDATDQTFMAEVIERSQQQPVVVDFWAPWCEPCKTLGPTLERVATEEGVTLVKVNTDESPRVAQALQIQSIPAVKAFKDGQVIAEFVGAQPEPEVRRFFGSLNPSEADRLADMGSLALQQNDLDTARRYFEAALQADPEHGRAAGGLIAILVDLGDLDGAEEIAHRMQTNPEVQRFAALIRFARGAAGQDWDTLRARVEADEDDVEAQYHLGCLLAEAGEWEQALERFLHVVKTDRSFQDDAGRLAMLDIFRLLGDEHPMTNDYRSRLTMVLF